MRVEIPAYITEAMRGDKFGEIVRTSRMKPTALHCRVRLLTSQKLGDTVELAHVRLDRSHKTVRVILADCREI